MAPDKPEPTKTSPAGPAGEPAESGERSGSTGHHHHRHTGSGPGAGETHDDRTASELVAAADVAFERGDFDGAVILARKAIKTDGGEQAYLMAGDASFKIDDIATARTMYEEALKRNPSSSLARHRLEMVSAKQSQAANKRP